jgi:hypothetical protein
VAAGAAGAARLNERGRFLMRMTAIAVTVTCSSLLALAGGCGPTYYKVTDPTTGKQYYTTELKKHEHGSATIKDAKTGAEVSLQNTEITKVTKEEYDVARFSQPAQVEKKEEATPFK